MPSVFSQTHTGASLVLAYLDILSQWQGEWGQQVLPAGSKLRGVETKSLLLILSALAPEWVITNPTTNNHSYTE